MVHEKEKKKEGKVENNRRIHIQESASSIVRDVPQENREGNN